MTRNSLKNSLEPKKNLKSSKPQTLNILLIVSKCIRGGICHAIHQYVKADNKYMKDYDINNESSYL